MDNAELTTESENLLTKTRKSVSLADNVVILNDSARASRSSDKSEQNLTDNGPSSSNASSKKGSRKTGSKRKVRRSTKSVHSIPSKNNNKVIKSTHRTSRPSTRNVSVATLIETKDRFAYTDALITTNQNDSRHLASASSISIFQENISSRSSQDDRDNHSTQSKKRSNNKIVPDGATARSNEREPSNLTFIQNVFNKFKDKNSQTQNTLNKKNFNKGNVSNFKKKMLRLFRSSGKSVTCDQSSSIIFDESSKDSLGIETTTENCKASIKTLYRNEKPVKEAEQLIYALLNEIEKRDVRATKSTDNEQNLSNSYKNEAFEYIMRKERTWLEEKSDAGKDPSNEKHKTVSGIPFLKVPLDFLENRNKGYENVDIETRSSNGESDGIKSHSVRNNRIASRKSSLGSVFNKVSISSNKYSQMTGNAKIYGKNDYSKEHDVLMSSFPVQEINNDKRALNKCRSITRNEGTEIRKVNSSNSQKSMKSLLKHSTMDISNDAMKLNSERYYGYNIGLVISDPIMTDVRRTKSLSNICLNTSLDLKDMKIQSNLYSNMSQNETLAIDDGVENNLQYQESEKKSKNKSISGLHPWSPISNDISKVEENDAMKCQQPFAEKIIIKPSSFKKSSEKESSNQIEKFFYETKSTTSDDSKEPLKKFQNVKMCTNENFVSISPEVIPAREFDLSKTDSETLKFENVSTYTLPIENSVSKNIETQENLGSNDLSNLSGTKGLNNTSTNRSKNSLMTLMSRRSKSSKKSSDNSVHNKSKNEKKFQISIEQFSHMPFQDRTKLPEIITRKRREWIKNSIEDIQNNKPLIPKKDSEQTFKKTSSLLSRIFHSNRSTDKKTHDHCSNSHYPTSNTADTTMAPNIVTLGEDITRKSYNIGHRTVNDATSTSKIFFNNNSVMQQLARHSKLAELKNVDQDEYLEKSTASIFKRRSSLIMTVIPISNRNITSPVTADNNEQCYYFYYFLGPPLDAALVDIVTVVKQLIDKISNNRTDRHR